MSNWTALQVFSLEYFRSLYSSEKSLSYHQRNCQFFRYQTPFTSLGNALKSVKEFESTNRTWYIGWSNCDYRIANKLRNHYRRPSFLPIDSAMMRTDWIFMGTPGYGAHMHIDNVRYASWQAQVRGSKRWTLRPAYECRLTCPDPLYVQVEAGEIIVLDTNRWYHETNIVSNDLSITIGAEFD